ncbi:membrane carboxypeptidase (penicillin-binding protein) [Rubidibacter lacunae KORDI 51-2]|uniref:Membrane carboxypeptidase (Penicillin-binding protein) n=1 Tax=Rubidibacter lacunae KORDI 51-2 TaxID=582515 RepID=U5DEE9_9CHRO|nr:transglycosylase domain-containing protein [Rubidibacter lacunae]ERN39996.1 membrane carboxypeptidase (penicillin-binding protein) [Rubidibacter lacunae KORDI 51-2]
MTDRPTFGQYVTQAFQTIQAKLSPQILHLKPGARVPELRVKAPDADAPATYPLLGDRYVLGRSARECDIVVRNPLVSTVHLTLTRDLQRRERFVLTDEGSKNGTFHGKRQIEMLELCHGDRLTLGPPEVETTVEVSFHFPPPLWRRGLRYGCYAAIAGVGILSAIVVVRLSRVPVRPLPAGGRGPVVVYARDGQTPLQPELGNRVHRELPRLQDFSPYLPAAVLASEDTRYYWHFGVDPYGIARALWVNITGGRQGASTITQQLARSLFPEYVGRQDTLGRKWRELEVALKLEFFYSKDELLKVYLNRAFLGVDNYGFEDAAQFYFEKSAADLTLNEAATLVAILPAPNSYNPVQDYDTAVQLRARVLERMVAMGAIAPEEATRARRSRIDVSPRARERFTSTIAPYYYAYVLQELQLLLGSDLADEGNFIVETAADLKVQDAAEAALQQAIAARGAQYGYGQGAIVTLDSRTGAALAIVGGKDFAQSQFNRATQAQRQPGSTFKAVVYAAALEMGISPGRTFSCTPLRWMGQSYNGCDRTRDDADMYRGFAHSENVVALRIAQQVGLDAVVQMARDLGIASELNTSPGLVLGESEVNVLELTGAYAPFANGGTWHRPHAIQRIRDGSDCTDVEEWRTCRTIYAFVTERESRRVLEPAIAAWMGELLRGVVRWGTGTNARGVADAAGKTGTTDNGVDLWFVGFAPQQPLVTGIWLGNDDNSPTRASSSQAALLWSEYMQKILPISVSGARP